MQRFLLRLPDSLPQYATSLRSCQGFKRSAPDNGSGIAAKQACITALESSAEMGTPQEFGSTGGGCTPHYDVPVNSLKLTRSSVWITFSRFGVSGANGSANPGSRSS